MSVPTPAPPAVEPAAGPAAPGGRPLRALATVDLAAVRHNVGVLAERASSAAVMAVVKADAYGHGLVPCGQAAVAAGASWLGTALLDEALALRAAGVPGRVLAWLSVPGERWAQALLADVDVAASDPWALAEIAAAARETGVPARVHLKVDSGLGRAGAAPAEWPALVAAACALEAEGVLHAVGVWSHLAWADVPHHPSLDAQVATFREAVALAERAGLRPEVRHLANSGATLGVPQAHFDLVRPGIAVYGISPGPGVGSSASLGLVPAMTLTARLALVKRVEGGQGVSYNHRYVTSGPTHLGLVPLGYADGVPRAATNTGPLLAGGRRVQVAGTVCMDQFVVDLGDAPASAGDEVVLFGPGTRGEPLVDDWAQAASTIGYEIVTRLGPRVPRVHVDSAASAWVAG